MARLRDDNGWACSKDLRPGSQCSYGDALKSSHVTHHITKHNHHHHCHHHHQQQQQQQRHQHRYRITSASSWLPPVALFFLFFILLPHVAMAAVYSIPLHHMDGNSALRDDVSPLLREAASAHGSSMANRVRRADAKPGRLAGKPGQGYYIAMWVGSPPQQVNVLIDTGSSNFAVAAAPNPDIATYFNISDSETFEDLGTDVNVPYTQGNWQGILGRDLVTISSLPGVNVTANVACITNSESFFINGSHWQGILGMAYAAIARPDPSVEPFFDSLVQQTDVDDIFSLQLCGTKDKKTEMDVSMGGTLVIGGVNESLYQGALQYVPLYKESYYEVVVTDILVNEESAALDCKEYNFDKTIVDSGTTNLRLPNKVFQKVVHMLREQTIMSNAENAEAFWRGTGILCWPRADSRWPAFPAVNIHIAQTTTSTIRLVVSPLQYLREVYDVTEEEERPGNVCYKFAIAPSDKGLVLGAVVMEGFYVVFDRANRRMGFAQTTCLNKQTDALLPKVTGPFPYANTTDCAYQRVDGEQSVLLTVAYVMAGVCGACLLPVVYMLAQWQWRRCRRRDGGDAVSDNSGLLKEEDFSGR